MSGQRWAGDATEFASPIRTAQALAAPAVIALAAVVYLAVMIVDMSAVPGMPTLMMNPQPFAPIQFFALLVMWAVMMAAMMLPAAAPMILAYARLQTAADGRSAVFFFALGYILVWTIFSLGATALQALMVDRAFMSPMMMKVGNDLVAGTILIAAGIYQFTPLKGTCLRQCRTPMSFLMTAWRDGNFGALCMGLRHGVFCVGCCWALMGLLFVAGVMNPVWIAAITIYVLAEKVLPAGRIISKTTGLCLTGAGLWLLT